MSPFAGPSRSRSRLAAPLAAALALALPGAAGAFHPDVRTPQEGQLDFRPEEILVKFKKHVGRDGKDRIHAKHGSRRVKELRGIGVERVKLRKGLAVTKAVAEYQAEPDVEYAEPDYAYRAQAWPDDPLAGRLWGMHNVGQTGGTVDADVDAPEAWDLVTGAADGSVVVGVLDTGIDQTHEDIGANLWTNPGEVPGNGVDDEGNGYVDDVHGINAITGTGDPADDHGHGTHVAGSIGAVGHNGTGVVGVSWGVKIVSCKFLNARGTGYASMAADCLEYLRDLKARGVNVVLTNNSWGGGGFSQTFRDAVRAHEEAGILFVAAAGNADVGYDVDESPIFPASIRTANMVVVAATDHADAKAGFSNYGRRTVHVAAPGVDVVSLRAPGTDLYGDGLHFVPEEAGTAARYYRASGTSMATPHVSGVATLLHASDPSRPWWAVRNLLLAGGDPNAATATSTATGRRLNAHGSLTCQGRSVLAPVQVPAHYPEYTVGKAAVLQAYSITCDQAVGPVTATTAAGVTVPLRDDGVAPDAVAGDGLFSAHWTPTADTDDLRFDSPLGTAQTGRIPAFVVTSDPPAAKVLTTYEAQLEAAGGVRPLAWSLMDGGGSLPPGVTLDASGRLSGTPTAVGDYSSWVSVEDATRRWIHVPLDLPVTEAPVAGAWQRTEGGSVRDIAVDAAGNAYALVWVDYSSGLGVDLSEPLLKKYDPAGQLLWERRAGGTPSSWWRYRQAVDVDAAGNVYLGVNRKEGVWVVQKRSPEGDLLWERTHDDARYPGHDFLSGLAVGPDGLVRVTGSGYQYPANPNSWWHTVAYDAEGSVVWERDHDGYDYPWMATDAAGNTFVVGNPGSGDHRIVKYGRDGTQLWSRVISKQLPFALKGVAAGPDGGLVTVGTSQRQEGGAWVFRRFVEKYDALGNLAWSRVEVVPSSGVTYAGVTVGADGDVLVVGGNVNATELTSFTREGERSWTRTLEATPWWDAGRTVTVAPGGRRVYVGSDGPFGSLLYERFPVGYTIALDVRYPHVVDPAPPYGLTGALYRWTPRGAYGTPPYAWSMSPPDAVPGVALDPATGTLSGATTAPGSYGFRLSLADAAGTQTARDLVLDVYDVLAIVTSSLPRARVGEPYSAALEASGGIPPYAWTLVAGALPPGLALDGSGAIAGTPTVPGEFTFTVKVVDAGNVGAETRAFAIAVAPPLSVETASLPATHVGRPYSFALAAAGGFAPYAWSVTAGAPPPDVALSTGGVLSGVASAAGTFSFTASVFDADGHGASRDLSLLVLDPVVVPTVALPDGTVGAAYSATLSATGGQPPYAWAVSEGALPLGISFVDGAVYGWPAKPGTWKFTVTARDAAGGSDAREVTLRVAKVTTFHVHTVTGAGATYGAGPQFARFGDASGDSPVGDVVSVRMAGTRSLLVGWLSSAFPVDAEVSGEASGSALSFLAAGVGTGTASLVEVDPASGAVVRTLASVSRPLAAGVLGTISDLSALRGTVRAGYAAGIRLDVTTAKSVAGEVRYGKTNGGAVGEQIVRLRVQPSAAANQAPVAKAGPDRSAKGTAAIAFDGTRAFDPDGEVTGWHWDFGDGTGAYGATPVMKSWAARGTYTVTLTVTDESGATATDTAVVTVR